MKRAALGDQRNPTDTHEDSAFAYPASVPKTEPQW